MDPITTLYNLGVPAKIIAQTVGKSVSYVYNHIPEDPPTNPVYKTPKRIQTVTNRVAAIDHKLSDLKKDYNELQALRQEYSEFLKEKTPTVTVPDPDGALECPDHPDAWLYPPTTRCPKCDRVASPAHVEISIDDLIKHLRQKSVLSRATTTNKW